MRILHAISSTNPAHGGPIEGLKQIARSLEPYGVNVEIVSLDDPSSPWLDSLPLKVYPMGPGQGKFGKSERLVQWLAENGKNYDRIIVNGLWQFNGIAVWKTRKSHGRPYVVFSHGMLDPWFRKTYPLKHVKKQLFWLAGQHAVLRDASAVLFTSEEERQLAQNAFIPWGPYKERVISYGTAGSPFELDKARDTFLAKFPHLQGKRILLYLSRIHEKKGVDLMIRAFAKVAHENPDAHLVIAGPDETGWKVTLESIASELGITDRITWPGMLKDEMKWGAYGSAEAFCLPSHQENFGIVVAEALSCGLPVLISDKVNIWREIKGAGAAIVEPDNQIGTDALLRAWYQKSTEEREEMAKSAVTCFANNFEIGHAARSLMAIYRQIDDPKV